MSAFLLILKSYFKKDFDTIATAILAPLTLLSGVIATLAAGSSGPFRDRAFTIILLVFIMAVCYATFVVAAGLRNMLETGIGYLYPNFRQRHLVVSAVALLPFLTIPPLVLSLRDFPVLSSVAMIFLACACSAWIIITLGNSFISTLVLLGLLRTAYELLGLAEDPLITHSIDGVFAPFQAVEIPLFMIGLSFGFLMALGWYALRALPRKVSVKAYPFSNIFPVPTIASQDLVGRTLGRLKELAALEFSRGQNPSVKRMNALMRLSMFSPGYGFQSLFLSRSLPLYALIALALSVALYAVGTVTSLSDRLMPGLNPAVAFFSIYFFLAFAISTDFLFHRVQLPMLWLGSWYRSRHHFTYAVVACYLGVAGRMYLWLTLTLFVCAVLTPWISLKLAGGVAVMGLAVFLVLISLSLSMSASITSEKCTGWVIPNFTALVIVLQMLWVEGFFDDLSKVWATASLLFLMGLILLPFGITTLRRCELNFHGPGL